MTSQRWWRLAVVATALYFIYDLGPLDLPDISADAHRIIVGVLSVALAISGSIELIKRRTTRERERWLADAPTQPIPRVGKLVVEHEWPAAVLKEVYDSGWVDGLARRALRDGERRRRLPFV